MNTTTQCIYMEKQVTKTTCFSGSKAVIETLLREGVDTVFGYPGGTIMPVYDALYDYRNRLNHILVRHEQGALHAAQGYARVSGRPGVCIVTSGPGATNTDTGTARYGMPPISLQPSPRHSISPARDVPDPSW